MRKKGHPVTFPPFNLYLGFVCDQAVAASDESFVKRLLKKTFFRWILAPTAPTTRPTPTTPPTHPTPITQAREAADQKNVPGT